MPVLRYVFQLIDLYFDRKISRASAQLAYYLIMCLFPLLIVVTSIIGMLSIEKLDIIDQAIAGMPEAAGALIHDYLTYVQSNQSTAMLISGLVMTVISSSAAFRSMNNIFEEIFQHPSREGIWGNLFFMVVSLLLPLMIYGALIIVLLGDWLRSLIKSVLDVPVLHYGWQLAQWLLPFAATFLVLAALYRLTAPNRACGRRILPGALAGAVVLVVATQIFSAFMGISTRYTTVYGSLAAMMILLLWLFLCSNIILLGNAVNYLWTKCEPVKQGNTGKLPKLNRKK